MPIVRFQPPCTSRLPGALALAATLLLGAGCAAVDKAYVGTVAMVEPDALKLQQEARWLHPHPNFRMVSQSKMVVFVRVRDSAGSDLEVTRQVQMALEEIGYRVTHNIDEAQYVMQVDIRYYGENARADGGRASLAAGVGGAIAGGIIGHQSRRTGTGAVAGAVLGGMLFDVAAQRNKIREFDIVVDTRIGERVEGGVTTTRRSGEDTTTSSRSHAFTDGGAESGRSRADTEEFQSVQIEEDFLYSQNRLVIYVSKMNLAPEEAAPVLQARLIKSLANVLP